MAIEALTPAEQKKLLKEILTDTYLMEDVETDTIRKLEKALKLITDAQEEIKEAVKRVKPVIERQKAELSNTIDRAGVQAKALREESSRLGRMGPPKKGYEELAKKTEAVTPQVRRLEKLNYLSEKLA